MPFRSTSKLSHPAIWAVVALLACGTHVQAEDDLRLGNAVRPTFESMRLVLDADQKTYTGSVHLDLEIVESVPAFRMHAEEMTLERITLLPAGKGKTPIPVTTESGKLGLLTVRAEKPLAPGRYTLDIDFANEFSTRANSLYRMVQNDRGYLFTQFEADDAREAFPCFDEPGFKIPWQMTLVVPEKHMVLCNSPIEKESTAAGQRTVVFRKTPPLPSYLLAIAAGPLETVEIPGLGVPGRIVTVAGQSHLAGLAAQMTPPLLKALEKWFDQKYPFEKLDLIAIPEYWYGAMENPGAITFAANILLIDPKAASPSQRRNMARINAHELAHMWFGDLVTMQWWDDLWLNESFADWLGDKITQEVYPEYEVELSELGDIQRTMAGDVRPSALAIQRPVFPTDNMLDNVGTQYNKGKAVLGMFETWIGPENLRRGVLDYLRKHEWGNATSGDLWAAFAKVSGQDVPGAMATFLEQPALPLVTAEPQDGGKLRLRQERMKNAGVEVPQQSWKIPVAIEYSDGSKTRRETVLLDAPEKVVELGTKSKLQWVKPDADARGYYRWNVPAAQRNALLANPAQTMNARERIGCLGNLAALLDAGVLHGDEYLSALAQFANDPEPEVISTLASGVDKVYNAFVPAELEDVFAVYVRQTLGPALKRYGLQPVAGEDEAVTLVRPTLLSWVGNHGQEAQVRAEAARLSQAYLADPKSVDPSISGTVLGLAAQSGDRAMFETYKARFEAATVPAERSRFLGAIGNFRDPVIVEAILKYALEGPLRPQEITRLAGSIGNTPERRDRAFRWMTENYATIQGRLSKEFMNFLPAFANGCETQRVEAARVFFSDPARDTPSVRRSLARVSDAVGDCVRLREREGGAVTSYLTQRVEAR